MNEPTRLPSVDDPFLAEGVASLAPKKGTAWLDSTLSAGDRGRSSLFAHSPCLEFTFDNGILTMIADNRLSRLPVTVTEALEVLERLVNEHDWTAIGAITYEATFPFLQLPVRHPSETPELHFFLYDHVAQFHSSMDEDTPVPPLAGRPELRNRLDFSRYRRQVELILKHIHEGDIYQANLTHRFEIVCSAPPFLVYSRLRALSPSPYGAFINFGDYAALSSSPERMFLREGNRITTGPIKGTIRRGDGHLDDTRQTQKLQQSEKDLAEHLMIVDLERNDLGKIARTGSVKVEALFRPESYASLIHLTSDVAAELREQISFADICTALLPGGSITGAPKRRAVEILSSIEDRPRGLYTGCLGYLSRDRADFNIAIRTITWHNDRYQIHAGGGIVADSTPESEYRELNLKAGNMFRALGVEPQD